MTAFNMSLEITILYREITETWLIGAMGVVIKPLHKGAWW